MSANEAVEAPESGFSSKTLSSSLKGIVLGQERQVIDLKVPAPNIPADAVDLGSCPALFRKTIRTIVIIRLVTFLR